MFLNKLKNVMPLEASSVCVISGNRICLWNKFCLWKQNIKVEKKNVLSGRQGTGLCPELDCSCATVLMILIILLIHPDVPFKRAV